MSKPLAVKWGRGAFELIPSSIDEDDQRILGFEIFQSGIFLGRKISKVLFGVPSFGQGFFGYSKQSEDCRYSSTHVCCSRSSSPIKYSKLDLWWFEYLMPFSYGVWACHYSARVNVSSRDF